MADIKDYQRLVTSEHSDKLKFMATVATNCQPFVDIQNVALTLPELHDLDYAEGDQLDACGDWIGIGRDIPEPIPNVYFWWDDPGPGWDKGTWWDVGQPTTHLVALPDDAYRNVLRAKIALNHWDGTVPDAYAIWAVVFGNVGLRFLIQDNQDGSITYVVVSTNLDALTYALIVQGYFTLVAAGIRITGYFVPGTEGLPLLGWDIHNDMIQGWDEGQWLTRVALMRAA